MSSRFAWPALACAVVLVLTGCQYGSAADRINGALPPGTEFLAAKENLFAVAKSRAVAVDALQAELDTRMEQRATGCAGDFKPGLFDNDDSIRDQLADKECFAKADAGLVEWLGLRSVAITLDLPPLRPLPKTPATIETKGAASNLMFAQRAGVAIETRAPETQVFDIGSGAAIARHDRTASALSPNGRVYATQDGEVLQLRDVESDALLLTLHDARSRSLRFLGDAGALVSVKSSEGGRSRLEFIDFRSGRRSPAAIDDLLGDNRMNIAPLPGDGTRFLVSGYGQLIELQLVNGPDGAGVEVRRKLPVATTLRASVAVDGRSVSSVGANRIDVLDLSSMTTRGILLSPLRPLEVVPTPDPDKLVVTVSVPGDYKTEAYLYSMAARTLAPIDKTRAWGRITWLPTLKRNAMIDNARMVPLDTIPAGQAEDASAVIERATLAATQAAADAAMAQAARETAMAPFARDSTSASRREAIERTIRENNVPPAEAARLRQWVADVEAKAAPRSAAVQVPQPGSSTLQVPANADVRAVGVYEAADGSHGAGKARKPGSVRVFVSRSKRPIVLVLSSYEPVNWVLQLQDGAKVSNILLSSYHGSQAFGANGARIDSIGTQYAYKRGSSEFDALDAQVERLTSKRIGSFQGAYSGTSFSLGY